MVSNKDVFGYLKGNVGEESVLKMIGMSAIKSFFSVVVIVAGIIALMKLIEMYDTNTVYAFLIVYTFFSVIWCTIILGTFNNENRIEIDDTAMNYRKWKNFPNVLNFKNLLYFDWDGNNASPGEQASVFIYSGILSAMTVVVAFVIGVGIVWSLAFIYSFLTAIIVPPESLITFVTVGGSIILMTLLFIKLKWKKIFLIDSINWNLIAWCVCAAVILTVLSFVAGVAIRRIAGYIGIEYTIGLVSIYAIVTAIYVINDIRQWMDNKARMEESKESVEMISSPIRL